MGLPEHQNHLQCVLNTDTATPDPDSGGLGWDLIIRISKELSDTATAAGENHSLRSAAPKDKTGSLMVEVKPYNRKIFGAEGFFQPPWNHIK